MKHVVRLFSALAAVAVVGTLGPAEAQGATATTTMGISATVLSFCTISASALAFGTYSTVALPGTSTLTSTCTIGTTYNLGLDNGTGSGASTAVRKMTYSSNTLNYGLYSDSGHSSVVGTTVSTNTVPGTGTGVAQVTTIYGLIPGGQFVAPGAYADTVTASISY